MRQTYRAVQVTQVSTVPADRVQCPRLPELMPQFLVDRQGRVCVFKRIVVSALGFECSGYIEKAARLPGANAEFAIQGNSAPQMRLSGFIMAKVHVDNGDILMRTGLPEQVTGALRRAERDLMSGDPVLPVASLVEEVNQRPRNLPGVIVVTVVNSQGNGLQEYVIFRPEPVIRPTAFADNLGPSSSTGRSEIKGVASLINRQCRRVRRVQVIIEDAADRCKTFGIVLVIAELLGGVSAQQIMKGESLRSVLGDHMDAS